MKKSKWLALLIVSAVLALSAGCGGLLQELDSSSDANSLHSSSESVESNSGSQAVDSESSEANTSSAEDSILQEDSVEDSASEENSIEESTSEEDSSPQEDSASAEDSTQEEDSSSEEDYFEEEERPALDEVYRMEADGKYVAIDVQHSISDRTGQMSFITKQSYQGIKRIAFNAKTGEEVSWWGIAIAQDTQTASLYNTDLIVGRATTNDYWTTFVFDFEDAGCTIYSTQGGYTPRELTELTKVPYTADGTYYIYFVGPLFETFSKPICLDNFTIVLADGTTYTDTFDDGANTGLFQTDKAVAHVIDNSIELGHIDEEETPMYETNEVFYQSDDQIDFTAYAPVTVENWSGSGTSNPNLVTEEQYRYMAEAGFTKSLGLYEGRTGDSGLTFNEKAEKDALAVLQIAQKYGIEYYVLNEKFYNFVRPEINVDFFDLTIEDGKFYNSDGAEVSGCDCYRYLKTNWTELYHAKLSAMFGEGT